MGLFGAVREISTPWNCLKSSYTEGGWGWFLVGGGGGGGWGFLGSGFVM